MFARRNFRELLAELKFRVFIFANDCLIIYISYIAYILVLMFTLLSVQKDGGIVRFCELRAWIPCVSRDLLGCQDGRRWYLFWGTTSITADGLEELLNRLQHVFSWNTIRCKIRRRSITVHVYKMCGDGKCSRNKCSRMWRHSRNSRKFPLANISTHTVYICIYRYIYNVDAVVV